MLEFAEGSELKSPVASADDDLYADDGQDMASFLTPEEQQKLNAGRPSIDDSELFAMLDDEIEQMAKVEEDETDLMAGLSDDDFISHVPPLRMQGPIRLSMPAKMERQSYCWMVQPPHPEARGLSNGFGVMGCRKK